MAGLARALVVAGVLGVSAVGVGVLTAPAARATTGSLAAADVAAPKLVVVKFHADWCGKCRAMEVPLTRARAALVDEPVLFVRFDFTDQSTARQSEFLASVTGYEAMWGQYERRTGFSILVNAATGELLEELDTPDEAAIETAIRAHL